MRRREQEEEEGDEGKQRQKRLAGSLEIDCDREARNRPDAAAAANRDGVADGAAC